MILLHAMGAEAANVHLGTRHQRKKILNDLQKRKSGWLRNAAKEMAKATERDWKKISPSVQVTGQPLFPSWNFPPILLPNSCNHVPK